MKANELRQKDRQALEKELYELLREHFNLRMQRGMGQVSRPDQFSKVKKNIARVKTVLNEQKFSERKDS